MVRYSKHSDKQHSIILVSARLCLQHIVQYMWSTLEYNEDPLQSNEEENVIVDSETETVLSRESSGAVGQKSLSDKVKEVEKASDDPDEPDCPTGLIIESGSGDTSADNDNGQNLVSMCILKHAGRCFRRTREIMELQVQLGGNEVIQADQGKILELIRIL